LGWGYRDYKPTRTREAEGGIKSRAKSDGSWWSSKWYDFMGTFDIGSRLDRGRTYARKGQVLDVSVEPGLVSAMVQGSRVRPYKVAIEFEQISQEGWTRIIDRLKEQAFYSSSLLSGEVPQEMEEFFRVEGASLFPTLKSHHDMDCSCPDYSVPCKHIAAVFYVIGDAFDSDPFLIFLLRGMPRDRLLESLGSADAGVPGMDDFSSETEILTLGDDFYNGLRITDDVIGPIPSPPRVSGKTGDTAPSILKRLGKFPFWRGEQPLSESLAGIYKSAAARGRSISIGESCGADSEE
jgi:uncharacterized Zn finger protein